ncbi:abc transporter B family protein [Naegleria gruberi]|uniref:Abc transporter B family protein n=1 Tax=Naegleria gruberi TaxID=5762 RepID=D2V6L7_NAEGR|nr:abc transporter B family protein [Naegleria gruberi]EFC47599.1 abc transporter B family protein [Naegleria gruberi]|eukprot:XP_002680343.1 abc transporter B family protein [Naegleria gruberi strain NEG-M]
MSINSNQKEGASTSTMDTLPNSAPEKPQNEEIKDEREPKLYFFDHFRIFKLFGWTWFLILLGMLGSMGNGVIMLIFQFIFGDLINIFQPVNGVMPSTDVMRAAISDISLKFTYVAIGSMVASFTAQFFLSWANERIGITLRKSYFNQLTNQDVAFFDIKKTGALTLPLSDDISKIQDAWTNKLSTLMQHLTTIIIGLVLAFVSSWQMSLVSISTVPLMLVIGGVMGKFTEVLTVRSGNVISKSASKANEVVSSFKTVKSMGVEGREQLQFASILKKLHLYGLLKALTQGVSMGAENLIMWGTSSLAFWYAGNLVIDGVITIGDLVKVFGLLLFAIFSMAQGFIMLPDISKALASHRTLLLVIKRKPAIPTTGGKSLGENVGKIEFRNVKFSYPSRPDVKVLEDFSLNIEVGQSIALVGPSGSGKSTIVGLLERFYDPQEGSVLIDGVDIKEIDSAWLHKNIGIVTQEPVLFACSIRENIAYAVGIENVTDQEIEKAARAANCHNFIVDLPNGYNTLLGEKGVSLSGGQKQRVAIARALLQNPKVLLLDEATSALDTESEALVQAALETLMKGRTSISIAHRLSTVQNCDVIYVLVKGEIKESGLHSDLLNVQDGIYRKLAEKQMVISEQ